MKTKIRTFIGIIALGLFAFVNINAAFVNINSAAGNKKAIHAIVVEEKEESRNIEAWMLENEFWAPKSEIEPMESEKALEVEQWMMDEVLFLKSAESFTTSGADSEIAKYSKKQVALEELRSGK